MANPQKENGFTAISNEILKVLIRQNISGQEFRMVFLILRKTYGFNKKEDFISLSQMAKSLKISHIRCSQIINSLQLRKIITLTQNLNGIGKEYRFNKDYEQWTTLNKNINPIRKTKSTLNVLRSLPLRKTDSTIDTITKDTSLGLEKSFNYWNNHKSYSGNCLNNTVRYKLLPECRKITPAIEKSFLGLKDYQEDDFLESIKNYAQEIINRNPANDYANHRFSFYEFFTQKNGFIKFLNR